MAFMCSTRAWGYSSACSRSDATGSTSLVTKVRTAATSSSARAGSVGTPRSWRGGPAILPFCASPAAYLQLTAHETAVLGFGALGFEDVAGAGGLPVDIAGQEVEPAVGDLLEGQAVLVAALVLEAFHHP